jgi:dolichyl-phosphate-mannose--protein O-mannosyl transferase
VQAILRFLRLPVVALAAVTALAGGLRFYELGHPPVRVFDEVYYSKDACLYAGYTPRHCDLASSGERYWVVIERASRGETSWVHPPLGKWAIAAGIKGVGNDPFGWRVASAAAGTATVALLAAMAWLLFGSVLWTYVAGLLLATENLSFVQSRVSMLDVFLAFWVTLGFLLLLLDRRWIARRTARAAELSPGPGAMAVDETLPDTRATRPAVPSPLWRPWRFAAGFALGCACATKWSGAMALAGGALLSAIWEVVRRHRAGVRNPLWSAIRMELLGGVLAFLIVPVAVYLVSYTRYFVFQSWHPSVFWDLQRSAWQFHSSLHYINAQGHNAHPYESKPWTWLPMFRPVSYYFKSPGTEIMAMGHPLLFWGSVFTIPWVAWSWFKRRDWRAGFVVVAALTQYLPWFAVASRVQFFFYILPATPFLVLAAVYALRDLAAVHPAGSGARPYLPVAVAYVGLYVAMFAFFYPVLTGMHLSYSAWHVRMWMPSWI